MKYQLELEKVSEKIKKEKAKKVVIQLPDGLKPKATEIVNYLKEKTGVEVMIWSGSCFGHCDIPNIKADLLIQFGHSKDLKTYKEK